MMERNNKFNSLTPEILNENRKIYTEALDYAFSNSDIKNIAITGIYGAGKSTVWNTYLKKKKNFKNIITVSLGQYEDELDYSVRDTLRENTDNSIDDRVERQLINQILSQIKGKKIPLSKYRIKENRSWWSNLLQSLLLSSFIISILLWVMVDKIIVLATDLKYDFNLVSFSRICGLMFLFPLIYFIYIFYRDNRFRLSKINFKGAEANLGEIENSDETIFDKNIKELVYLLKSSKAKVIVFEDLDRYDNIEIFTKLRELNFLLNKHVYVNGNVALIKFLYNFLLNKCSYVNDSIAPIKFLYNFLLNKCSHLNGYTAPIRFVYMVRDGLFISKNRVKFFDFILPIVPVIDSKNSENKLLEYVQNIENKPDEKVLSKIALYIDDMRLLKNIINEYIIYSNVIALKTLELNKEKLFSLIVLKNICPYEFDLLQENKGYIVSVFNNINEHRIRLAKELESEIKKIDNEIKDIENRIEQDKFQIMALSIPVTVCLYNFQNINWAEFLREYSKKPEEEFYITYNNGARRSYIYPTFIEKYNLENDENQELISKFEFGKKREVQHLMNKKAKIKNQLYAINTCTLKEILLKLSVDKIENVFELRENTILNYDFHIIKFLILDGLIDETYWHYKSYFYFGSLGKNDTIFLKNLLESKEQDVLLDIENPNKIIEKLEIKDFVRFNILNKKLFENCLMLDNNIYIKKITESVMRNELYQELVKIIETLTLESVKRYVAILLECNFDCLIEALEVAAGNSLVASESILISICTSNEISVEELGKFKNFIEENENLISLIDESDFSNFITNIYKSNIKFQNLSESETNVKRLKNIESIQAYKLSIDNILFIVNQLLDKDIQYGNLLNTIYENNILEKSREYIQNNFDEFICEYIDGNIYEESYTNSEKLLINILSSNISIDYKKKYVVYNETIVTNVNELKNITNIGDICNDFFDKDKIVFNSDSIAFYWSVSKKYSTNFLNYLDRNINDENVNEVLKENYIMCNTLVNDDEITDKVFDFTLKFVDKKIEKINNKLPSDRISKLINNNLISVTEHNVNTLVENEFNSEIIQFILQENELEDEIFEIILGNELSRDLVYLLINSDVSDENALKCIDYLNDETKIEKIYSDKLELLEYVIENYLSSDNISYICNNFEGFDLKNQFIDSLYEKDRLMELKDDDLNKNVLMNILSKIEIDVDIKVQLIIIKVKSKTNEKELMEYIEAVPKISNISTVWQNKRPKIDNTYEEEIAEALINSRYVKKYGDKKVNRITLNKKRILK